MKSLTKFNCVSNNNEVTTSREQDKFAGIEYLMNSLLSKCLVRAISALTNCTIKPFMQICKLVADAEEKSSSLGWFQKEKPGTNELFQLGVHTSGWTKVLPICSTKFNLKLTGDSLIRMSGQLTDFELSMRCKLRICLPKLKRMMSGFRRRTSQSTSLSVYSLICATLLLIFQIDSGMAQSTTVSISSDAGNMAGVGTGVTEGSSFKYKLERLPAMGPERRNVTVAVTVTGTGHEKVSLYHGSPSGSRIRKDGAAFSVDLPLNSDYVESIYLTGNVADTDAVKIKVELVTTPTPTNYTVGSDRSITVNVKDNDNPSVSNPTLSVSGPSRKVRADIGELAVFKVRANYGSNTAAPYPRKSVRFEVSQTNGDFLGSLDSFTMSGGALVQELSIEENVTEFSIPTEDSNTEQDDSDGSIRVRLLESEGYTLGNDTSLATIVDTPQGRILTINTEHDDAKNKLTINISGSEVPSYIDNTSHCIGLEVTGDTDIVLGTVSSDLHEGAFTSNIPNMGVYTVLITVGAYTYYNGASIVIDIDDDNGEITYRLLDARDTRIDCFRSDYQLASDQTYSAKFTEGPREVTIETDAKDTGVTEGYSFDYTVRRTGSATSKVDVPVTVEVTPAGTTGITLTDAAGTAISSGQFNVEITAESRTSASQTINVTGDVGADDDVKVKVNIPSAPTTYVLGTDSSVSVKVKDNDSATAADPIITIAPHEDNPVFTDVGLSAKFRVTAAPDRSNENGILRVNYTVSQSGDFLHRDSQSPTGYVNIAEGETTAVIRIYTKSDDPNAGDGSISVKVVDGLGYTLSNNLDDTTAMVAVKVPLPKISISSQGTDIGVSERASFEFTLTRAGNTTIPLEVFVFMGISGTESANVAFSSLRPTSFTFPIGASTITRTLSLSSTSNVRKAGTFVNVELRNSTTLTYVLDRDRMTSISVPVNDIDILKMVISGPSSIVEGDVASFKITAFDFAGTVNTGKAISVNYRVINLSGDFLAAGEARVDEVTIAEGANSAQFNVSTDVKTPNGTDGSFAVELRDGTDYVVSDVLSEKRVAVSVANPALPYVRVLDNSVMEGDSGSTSVSFKVSLSEPMETEFSLDWAVSLGSSSSVDYTDFVGGTADGPLPNGTISFEFAEGETATVEMTSFTVETQGDGLVEPDENFTVTLSNPTANGTSYAGIAIVDPTATGTIENDDHPVVSLSTDVSSVAEGSTFDVTLTAVPAPVSGYSIEIATLSLDSSGITGTFPATPIGIGSSGIATVTVTATDDDYFSDGGILTVQLADGTSYTADTEQNIASVAVTDNEDFPVVALTSSRKYLTEGNTFSVTLETLQTIGGGYELMVSTLFVDSSGFAGTISPSVIAIGNSGIATARVTATDDSVTGNGGNLTVTLQNGTNYTADAANNSVVILVSDNDYRSDRRGSGSDFTVSLHYDSSTPHGFLPQSGNFSFENRVENPYASNFSFWASFSGSPNIDYRITPQLTPNLNHLSMDFLHLHGRASFISPGRNVPAGTANVVIDATRTVSDLYYVTDSSADTYTTNPLTIYRSTPDKPGVIITRNSESVSENEDAEFTVEAVTAPATGNDTVVTVNLSHGMNEDFLDSTQSLNPTVTLTNASPSQTLAVKLDDDSEYEPDGTITAVLAAGGAEYVVSPITNSATITLQNNDINQYEISIESDFVNVIAGAEFGFEVSAKPSMTPAVTEDLTVILDISDDNAGFLNTFPTQLIIPTGKTSATGFVTTNALETLTGTPTITVALSTSGAANQTTSTTHGSLAIPIVAIESLPTISMHGPDEPVTEGDAIQFRIELSAKQSADTSLRVFVDEVNDQGTAADRRSFLAAPVVNKLIRIPGGHRTVAFTVPTVDDAMDEVEGVVKAQVVLGAGYQGSAEAFADVLDNDGLVRLRLSAPETVAENAGSFNATITARRSPGSFPLAFTLVRSGGNFLQDAEAARTATDAAVTFDGPNNDGEYTYELAVNLDNDAVKEPTGSVTVTLTATSNYRVIESAASKIVTIYDDDAPELLIRELGDVSEGDPGDPVAATADFSVEARVMPNQGKSNAGMLRVYYNRVSANYLVSGAAADTSSDLTFSDESGNGSGPFIATLSETIAGNTTADGDGTYVVTLSPEPLPGSNYHVADTASGNHTATVNVIDDESIVELTMSTPNAVAESDGSFHATITANRDPGPIVLAYSLENTVGDFLTDAEAAKTGTESPVTFKGPNSDGDYTFDLEVSLHNDEENERTGAVTLNLTSTSNYTVDEATATKRVTVYDDDAPELLIRGLGDVIEGNPDDAQVVTANFAVEARVMPNLGDSDEGMLRVRFNQSSSTYLATGSSADAAADLTFTDSSGDGTGPFIAQLMLPIASNTTADGDGTYVVALVPESPAGTTYHVVDSATGDHTATVNVIDDESLPTVTVTGPAAGTLENAGVVAFSIVLNVMPTEDLVVAFMPTNVGSSDFLAHSYPSEAEMAAGTAAYPTATLAQTDFQADGTGNYSATLNVQLEDDTVGEHSGEIMLALKQVSAENGRFKLGTQSSANATVWDDDAPEIWISASTPDVIESDGEASFTITSRVKPPTNPFLVRYRPESSNFLTAADTGSEQVSAPLMFTPQSADETGSNVATLTVKLDVDTVDDQSGPLTVTLLNDQYPPKYMLNNSADTPVTASVFVFDSQGTPTATLFRLADSIIEGQPAEFRVRIHPLAQRSLRVNLNVSQVGDFLFRGPKYVVVPAEGTTTLSIGTTDDLMDELDGSLTVTVVDGDDYEAGQSRNNTVRITDNDAQGSSGTMYSVAAAVITDILMQIPDTQSGSAVRLGAAGPVVTITAVSQSIREGETAVFEISAAPAPSEATTVGVNLEEVGDFINGSHTVSVFLNAGETTAELRVATADDAIAEPDGSIIAQLASGTDYRVTDDIQQSSATVNVSDEQDRIRQHQLEQAAISRINAANMEVLPVLAGSMGARLQDATATRIQQAFSDSGESEFNLSGLSSIQDMVKTGGEAVNDGMKPWQEMLDNSSFTLDLYPEAGNSSTATIWGLGDNRSVADSASGSSQLRDGSMFTGHIGMDTRISRELIAGVIASVADSETGYGPASDNGLSYDSRSTGLHPYLGFQSADGKTQLLSSFGFGTGETGIESETLGLQTLHSNFYTVVANGSTQFYSADNILGGTSELSLAGESWLTGHNLQGSESGLEAMNFNASHYTLSIEGTHRMPVASTSSFEPSVSVGIRGDGKGRDDFTGLEMTAGSAFSSPATGLSVSGNGLLLMFHGDRIRERSLQGSLAYDLGNDGLGLQLDVSPVWGRSDTTADNGLWDSNVLEYDEASAPYTDGAKLNFEVGYGFKMLEGTWTVNPYTEFEMVEGGLNSLQIGNRITVNQQMDFELEGSENTKAGGVANREVKLNGTIKW